MNLKEMRAAAFKAAQDLAAKYGDSMTSDQLAEVEAKMAEVRDLDKQIEEQERKSGLMDQLRNLAPDESAAKKAEGGQVVQSKSLGDHFVKHAKDVLANQATGARREYSTPEYEAKAANDPQLRPPSLVEGYATTYDRNIVNQRRNRLVAADLMGSATVTNATIKYLVEKANRVIEGAPATVAEGGAKPYVRFENFDVVTESLSKIAALTKLSDEMIEDFGFVADWVNNQLIYELSVVEEAQLLNGDGTGSNLTGLLNREGIQNATIGGGDDFDGIYKAKNLIPRATNLTADAFVINPTNADDLRLAKDANNQYLAGGPFQNQYGNGGLQEFGSVWGMRIVESESVPVGTAVIGAFRQGATVLRKGGLRVDSTNTNVDDFEHNLVTLRAEERLGLMVPLPAAFVKVTIGETTE